MRLWLEAQSIPVIALIVFGLSYLTAATAFLLARVASRLGWAHDFKHIPAMTLMPLAVLRRTLRLPCLTRLGKSRACRELCCSRSECVARNRVDGARVCPRCANAPARGGARAYQGHGRGGMAGDGAGRKRRGPDAARTDRGDRDGPGPQSDPARGATGATARGRRTGPSIGCEAQPDHAERRTDRRGPMGRHPRPHDPDPDDRRHG